MSSQLKTVVLLGLAIAGALAISACTSSEPAARDQPSSSAQAETSSSRAVAREDLGSLWPFTIERGTIECRGGEQAVFVAPDNKAYALNDKAEQAGLPNVEPLRANGSGGDKISLGALRSRTLQLCEHTR